MADQGYETDSTRTQGNPKHPVSLETAESYLAILFDVDDNIELRVLPMNRGSRVASRTIVYGELNRTGIETWLTAHNTPAYQGIYVGVNPRKEVRGSGRNSTHEDNDVLTYRSIFVDFDDATAEEAMERIDQANLPEPTLLIASGRQTGTHAYWRFKESLERDLWVGLQRALIRRLASDPAIKNPSRIMRLPGSFNHKRGHSCRILRTGARYEDWTELGIQPTETMEVLPYPDSSDIEPEYANLNSATHDYLNEAVPEGGRGRFAGRNVALFTAAIDFKGNNFPLDQAIKELADTRGIERDGLSKQEAYQVVRNAYSRVATPSYTEDRYVLDVSLTELYHRLKLGKGMPAPDYDPTKTGEYTIDVDDPSAGRREPGGTWEADDPFSEERPDGRPADPDERPYISNVVSRFVVERNKRKAVLCYKPVDQVAREMSESLNGWPRRSPMTGLFVTKETRRGGVEIWPLNDPSSLFAFLHDRAGVRWHSGDAESAVKAGSTFSSVTKKEFFEFVRENIEPSHIGVSTLPHYPKIKGMFYTPKFLPEPSAGLYVLQEFLAALNPATEIDRQLMLACMLTPGWGGPPGTRPMFVYTSDYGQGSGKTETAKAIGRIWGGAATLNYEDNWAALSKRLMSSDDWMKRAMIFDNVKGKFGGGAIESMVTSRYLSGHRMYQGTVSRLNDVTVMVTFNLPELTRDLAQRSVVIKVGKPRTTNFISWVNDFIDEHQDQLIADLLYILRQPGQPVSGVDRWRAWQEGVVSKLPGVNVDELLKRIVERRPEVDVDEDEATDIIRALGSYLLMDPDRKDGQVQVTNAEIIRVISESGNWQSNPSVSQRQNNRRCMKWIKKRLASFGLLSPLILTGSTRQHRSWVNDLGCPVARPAGGQGGNRSDTYKWDWAAAREAVEDFISGPLTGDDGDSGLDNIPI